MSVMQLDLFEIAAQRERQTMAALNPDPESLRLGDKVHVVWSNGVEFDGVCTGLRGFWDNRPEFRRDHWVLRTNIKYVGDAKPCEGFKDYCSFNPHRDEWIYTGRDEEYRVPDKSTIVERLTEQLRAVPFERRLSKFRRFEEEYPRLSYDYNTGMRLFSDAYDKAMIAVSTLDEVLSSEKVWTCRAEFPKEAVNYIREAIYPAPRETWLSLLKAIKWSEPAWTGTDGRKNWRVHSLSKRGMNVFTPLLDALIPQARTVAELLKLAAIRGEDNEYHVTQGKPKPFWVESQ